MPDNDRGDLINILIIQTLPKYLVQMYFMIYLYFLEFKNAL